MGDDEHMRYGRQLDEAVEGLLEEGDLKDDIVDRVISTIDDWEEEHANDADD